MSKRSKASHSLRLFLSYSHQDEKLRDQLAKHLSQLQEEGVIRPWHDSMIVPGTEWKGEIDKNLESARLILLLVSSDFVASDYCYGPEMARALERASTGDARVIPVILRPVDWLRSPFGNLEALPKDGKPITLWPNRDDAFNDVARAIRGVCQELMDQPGADSGAKDAPQVAPGTAKVGEARYHSSSSPFFFGRGITDPAPLFQSKAGAEIDSQSPSTAAELPGDRAARNRQDLAAPPDREAGWSLGGGRHGDVSGLEGSAMFLEVGLAEIRFPGAGSKQWERSARL